MSKKLIKLISTVFYLGYSPVIPGTVGSLVGLAIYILLRNNIAIYIITTIFLLVLGFGVAGEAEKILGRRDSPKIIIDEVCGILIALFLLPFNFVIIISAFFLFRAFDAIKVSPADKLQNLRGSAGIMLDDIVAGFYTNICFHVALKLLSFRT